MVIKSIASEEATPIPQSAQKASTYKKFFSLNADDDSLSSNDYFDQSDSDSDGFSTDNHSISSEDESVCSESSFYDSDREKMSSHMPVQSPPMRERREDKVEREEALPMQEKREAMEEKIRIPVKKQYPNESVFDDVKSVMASLPDRITREISVMPVSAASKSHYIIVAPKRSNTQDDDESRFVRKGLTEKRTTKIFAPRPKKKSKPKTFYRMHPPDWADNSIQGNKRARKMKNEDHNDDEISSMTSIPCSPKSLGSFFHSKKESANATESPVIAEKHDLGGKSFTTSIPACSPTSLGSFFHSKKESTNTTESPVIAERNDLMSPSAIASYFLPSQTPQRGHDSDIEGDDNKTKSDKSNSTKHSAMSRAPSQIGSFLKRKGSNIKEIIKSKVKRNDLKKSSHAKGSELGSVLGEEQSRTIVDKEGVEGRDVNLPDDSNDVGILSALTEDMSCGTSIALDTAKSDSELLENNDMSNEENSSSKNNLSENKPSETVEVQFKKLKFPALQRRNQEPFSPKRLGSCHIQVQADKTMVSKHNVDYVEEKVEEEDSGDDIHTDIKTTTLKKALSRLNSYKGKKRAPQQQSIDIAKASSNDNSVQTVEPDFGPAHKPRSILKNTPKSKKAEKTDVFTFSDWLIPNEKVVFTQLGGSARTDIKYRRNEEIHAPAPSSSDVLVKVETSTVSRTDCAVRAGTINVDDTCPITPGVDFVGYVVKCGRDATALHDINVRDRVAALITHGGNSQYVSIDAEQLVHVPRSVKDKEASVIVHTYLSAFQALHMSSATIGRYTNESLKGKQVFVFGGVSTVSQAAIQLAVLFGADVFTNALPKHFKFLRKLGVQTLGPEEDDWLKEIEGTMDIVIDPIHEEKSYKALNWKGFLVRLGLGNQKRETPGCVDSLEAWWANTMFGTLSRTFHYDIFTHWRTKLDESKTDLLYLFGLLEKGKISPCVADTLSLSKVRKAHIFLEGDRRIQGALVCRPWAVSKR